MQILLLTDPLLLHGYFKSAVQVSFLESYPTVGHPIRKPNTHACMFLYKIASSNKSIQPRHSISSVYLDQKILNNGGKIDIVLGLRVAASLAIDYLLQPIDVRDCEKRVRRNLTREGEREGIELCPSHGLCSSEAAILGVGVVCMLFHLSVNLQVYRIS